MTRITPRVRVELCVCGHQRPEHADGRYSDWDGPIHPGPCKACGRCKSFRVAA